jgi:hypothetical protein
MKGLRMKIENPIYFGAGIHLLYSAMVGNKAEEFHSRR